MHLSVLADENREVHDMVIGNIDLFSCSGTEIGKPAWNGPAARTRQRR